MPDFEIFKRIHARASHGPTLTVTTRSALNLSRAAWELLGKPAAVTLLYAADERIIGLKPADRDAPNAYLVRVLGKYGRQVAARVFCRYIEADLSAARRYPLVLDDGIGCVDLREPGVVVTSNRAKPPVAS